MSLSVPTPAESLSRYVPTPKHMALSPFGASIFYALPLLIPPRRPALLTPAVHGRLPVLLRWHGGKWRVAPWIIENFPEHHCYTESFGGGGSVMLQKPRCFAEVYNDLDGEVVALFRILLDASATERLAELTWLTPFSREILTEAYIGGGTDMQKAHKLLTRSFLGFSPTASTRKRHSGLATSTAPGKFEPSRWLSVPETTRALVERMRGVQVENKPAMWIMAKHDRPECLHYVDPPYMPGSRGMGEEVELKADYRHEMSMEDHAELLRFLKTLTGYVVLSGYASELYDTELKHWRRIEKEVTTQDNTRRTEVLWINPHAAAALRNEGKLGGRQRDLFAGPMDVRS